MKHRFALKSRFRFALTAAAAALAFHAAPAAAEDGATYEVTVTGLWTAERFPLEYPKAGLLTGPHFSGVIGASHNGQYALFADGRAPTAGLERLSEEGRHSPLDQEIKDVRGQFVFELMGVQVVPPRAQFWQWETQRLP
jgi:hypothetical protein